MKYDHEMWNTIMAMMSYAERKLDGVMLAEVRGLHESAMNSFTLSMNQIAWFLEYFSGENHLNPPHGLDRLNDAETEASQSDDLQASSTENGKKSVKEAQRRIDERKRLRPVTESQEKLEQTKDARQEKELAVQRDKTERERPAQELTAARKAEKAAEEAVKKAEEAVKKGSEK